MKLILILLILAGGGYYYYDTQMHGGYSLSEVESNPIPKKYFYRLWDEVALNTCNYSQKQYNTTKERCENDILVKAISCSVKYSNDLPEEITNKKDTKKWGHKYLSCITPYYYCNGVEVTNEHEAKKQCN